MGDATLTSAERLSRRLLQLAALLSLLLIAVVLNSFLHSDGDPLNPVAAAAERTQQVPGAHMEITASASAASGAETISIHGEGDYNAATGSSRVRMTMAAPSGGSFEIEAVGDEQEVYLHSDRFSAELPPGKEWIGVPLKTLVGQGSATAAVSGNNAKEGLQMLRAVADEVETVGSDEIDGVATTRYRASVDLGRFASLLRSEGNEAAAEAYEQAAQQLPTPIGVEVWIDRAGLVRRLREAMTLTPQTGQPPVSFDLQIDLSHFGATPDIQLPDPAEVLDAGSLAPAALNS